MRIAARTIVEQRDTQIDLAIAVVIVFERVQKSVVIRVGILHDLFDSRRDRPRRRCLTAAMKLAILIDSPRAPLGACKVKLPIKHADVELAAAGIVLAKLTAIAERISLWMTGDPRLFIRRGHR